MFPNSVPRISMMSLRPLGGSCRLTKTAGRHTDEPLEVSGKLALVREPGTPGHLRQGEVAVLLQDLPRSLDASRDDELIRRQPGRRPELPREVVRAETGD